MNPKSLATSSERSPPVSGERAIIIANEHLLFRYSVGLIGGAAYRLTTGDADLWIVSILLTSPGYGPVGEVGVVAVDAMTGQIVGSTPHAEVAAAQKRLREENRDALEAAFLRAKQG